MLRRSLFVLLAIGSALISSQAHAAPGRLDIAQVNCNGTAVVRTEIGQLEVISVPVNIEGCIGSAPAQNTQTTAQNPAPALQSGSHVKTAPTSTGTIEKKKVSQKKKINLENGPLLDLASTQVGEYRIEKMKEQGIKYTNPVRSVRMHKTASNNGTTNAYLMKNDAVVVSQTGTGWTKAQGAEVKLLDSQENVVAPATYGKAKGYVATRFLRDPNPSDLVRIKQADQAYWSDIVHVNVAHLVNVRAHPWYGSKILFVLDNQTSLYVVSTVDDWSEVISDDRTIHGYVKSKYIVVDKAQRVEPKPLLK